VQDSRTGFWCRVFVFDVWVKGFVDVGGFTGRLVSCIGGYKYMRLQVYEITRLRRCDFRVLGFV